MLYVIVHVLPYAASSPFHSSNDSLLLLFLSPITISSTSLFFLFPFPPSSSSLPSSIFHPCFSISAPSIRGLDLSLSLSLGWFQGFPRLSYKGKTRLERVDIHSMRVKPTFTMQTWISMVSPNKYHEVSRCWPRRIASLLFLSFFFSSLTKGKLFSRLWSRFMKSGEMLTFYRVAWVVPLKR